MGTEAVWIPMVMAAAAATTNEVNNRRTARKQDEETARGLLKQQEQQRQATAKLNQTLDQTEASSPEKYAAEREGSFIRQLQKARMAGLNNLQSQGGASDAAKAYADTASGNAMGYAGNLANLFAKMDAAGLQRMSERNMQGDLGMDLNKYDRNAAQDDFLTRLRVSRIRPNFGLSLLAAGLGGAASGMAAGGAGTGTGAGNGVASNIGNRNIPGMSPSFTGNSYRFGSAGLPGLTG